MAGLSHGLLVFASMMLQISASLEAEKPSPWMRHSFDTNLYLQHEIFFHQDDPRLGTTILTTDLGGCAGLQDRLGELLPSMVSSENFQNYLRQNRSHEYSLRCLAEPDGSWFVVLDLAFGGCGNRHCYVEHVLKVFRFPVSGAAPPPSHLGSLRSFVNNDWYLHLTLADGSVTGMVIESHNVGEQNLDVIRFDPAKPHEIDYWYGSTLSLPGSSIDWSGNLVSMRPLGSYPNVGMLILAANDESIPLLQVYEVTPNGELVTAATSRDFGASDDPVTQDTTRLQANLDLIAWYVDLTEGRGTICPNVDGGWFSGHPRLESRMRAALAPYLVPSLDPVVANFDDWWRLGVSRSSSRLTCDPWTTEERYPRKEWRAAFGNDVYVAVATSGQIYVSSDGLNWSEPGPPWVGPANDVAFGHGHFRLVGDDGRVWSSQDGTNWTEVPVNSVDDLRAITATERGWVVVGERGVVVWLTTDAGWQIENIGSSFDLLDVTTDHENVVAVGRSGERGVAVSIDPDDVPRITPLPRPIDRLWAYRGDFIAADDEGEPWRSPGGAEWFAADGDFPVSELEGVDAIHVVGFRGRIGRINKKDGRVSWRPGSEDYPAYDPISGELIAGTNGGIALAAFERPGVRPILSLNFERYHLIKRGEFDPPYLREVENITPFNGGYIASTSYGELKWSVDGLHWQGAESNSDHTRSKRLAIWVAGPLAFSTGREKGILDISVDGRTWSGIDLGSFDVQGVKDITWTGDHWVMLTGDDQLLQSHDGRRWTAYRTAPRPPGGSKAISLIGETAILATRLDSGLAFARPVSEQGWCAGWVSDEVYQTNWRLAPVPGGAVVAVNSLSSVLATVDGDTWHQLLPATRPPRWEDALSFRQAIPTEDGVDLIALKRNQLMKSECKWRN